MANERNTACSRRGTALLTALALLAIFSILGAGYLTYMGIETDQIRYEAETRQARVGAEAGVHAAMGAIHQALADGEAVTDGDEFTYTLPVYRRHEDQLEARETRRVTVEVLVTDEQARLNLNHTPPPMLGAILGLDQDAVDALAAALPEPGEKPGNGRRWLASPNELVSRGILDAETYEQLDHSLVTTDSIPPSAPPVGFLNVNTIPQTALQVLLGIEDARLSDVLAERPFDNMDQLMNAAERASEVFAIAQEAVGPEALGFRSRALRLEATANLETRVNGDEWYTLRTRRAQAVAYFPEDATPRLSAWRMPPGGHEVDETPGHSEET